MMAKDDQDKDEYEFSELDSFEDKPMDDESASNSSSSPRSFSEGKDIKRNAIIAVSVIVLAMVIYKVVGWLSSGTDSKKPSQITAMPVKSAPQPVQAPIVVPTPAPVPVIEQPQLVSSSDNELKQKISSVEVSQQALRSEVNSLTDQVKEINNNINNINTQISNLKQIAVNLSNQVSKQSEEMSMLMIRLTPKPVKRLRYHVKVQPVIYYIQAVIPGRAWIIGTDGSTLTVREGTRVSGYGIVRLIDSMQGRILTTSGRIIKFSQDDS